ncbi:MAG: hypothetical protein ACR2LS_08350, partial [Thermomicrobiales bacterium]
MRWRDRNGAVTGPGAHGRHLDQLIPWCGGGGVVRGAPALRVAGGADQAQAVRRGAQVLPR